MIPVGVVRPIDSVFSDTLFTIGGFPVNNSALAIVLVLGVLLVATWLARKKFKLMPGFWQSLAEMLYEGILDFLFQITNSRKRARTLVPVIGALFLFILSCNLLGVLPIVGNITYEGKSIFRPPTADFNTTFSLALGALIIIHVISIKEFGVFGYIGRYIKIKGIYEGFKKGMMDGFVAVIDFFIGFLDIITEFARVVSLSLRLFGNIYAAGMVLGTVIAGLVAWGIPAIFTGLGLMFSVVQAVVFSALVTVYYLMSLPENSVEEQEEAVIG